MPSGLPLAVLAVTNFPVDAERFTERALLVPLPTRSVVVLDGHLADVAFETNFPDFALRLTERPMLGLLRSLWEAQLDPPDCNYGRRVVVVTVTRIVTGLVRTMRTMRVAMQTLLSGGDA